MSPTTQEEQAALNAQYQNLDGKARAELILTAAIGKRLTKEWIELIKQGVSELIVWHNKQHSNSKSCDYCEFVNDNITMFKVVDYWSDHFEALTKNK
jgi:hypothetical protein